MDESSLDYQTALQALHRRWWTYVLLYALFLAVGYFALRFFWDSGYALRWLALAAVASAYPVMVFRREMKHNHRPGQQALLPTLGLGNGLTLMRGMLVSGMVGFLLSPLPGSWVAWVPAGLYILSDVTDFLDGYLARKTDHATRLGEILEMSFDGYGVMVASVLIVQYGQVPAWYLLVAFARYLFTGGIWLRQRLDKPVYDLPPSAMRRAFAAWQMGFVAAVLLPVFTPPGTVIAAALFALPFLVGFLRDWLFVSGVLRQPGSLTPALQAATGIWLPLALRLLLPVLASASLIQHFLILGQQSPYFVILVLFEAAAILAVAVGFASRIAAIVGLIMLGIHQNLLGLSTAQYLMAVDYVAIMFLGSGPYALWRPEEYLIHQRAGQPRRA